jgi:predicted DNA-binding transcriptional regulator AlpA
MMGVSMEEYLTVRELSQRTKFAEQTLYNLINKGTLVQGKHYFKPTRKKIIFVWSEVLAWMKGTDSKSTEVPLVPSPPVPESETQTKANLIKI